MLTVVILTYNESVHLSRCLQSVLDIATRICVVDSGSTDNTIEIAKSFGAEVFSNSWTNSAKQFNWALGNCNIATQWVMRLDADEYLLPELAVEISSELLRFQDDIKAVCLSRRVIFKSRWLRFGGFYPIHLLRIWRNGLGHCEERFMDEHIVVERGEIVKLKHDFVDENLNDIYWWVNKHNSYARREAADLLNLKFGFVPPEKEYLFTTCRQALLKRSIKEKIYQNLPLGVRPTLYFLFRFFIQLGVLDGPRGWVFHFLQGFWYRLIVDINIWEFSRDTEGYSKDEMLEYLRYHWNINLNQQ